MLKRALYLSLVGSFLTLTSGCTGDDCGVVDCAPMAPPVIVSVLDSIEIGDTTIVGKVVDADVRVYIDNGAALIEFETLEFESTDSTYRKSDPFISDADLFAIVASHGSVSDTLTDLDLVRVEGCCPWTVLGVYRVDLAKKAG